MIQQVLQKSKVSGSGLDHRVVHRRFSSSADYSTTHGTPIVLIWVVPQAESQESALVNRWTASVSTVRTSGMKREIADVYVEDLPLHEESGSVS